MEYIRLNEEDEPEMIVDTYKSQREVIDDADRYYHEHFAGDDDYDPNFEVKTFSQSLEFWEANGYSISRKEKLNYKDNQNENERQC